MKIFQKKTLFMSSVLRQVKQKDDRNRVKNQFFNFDNLIFKNI